MSVQSNITNSVISGKKSPLTTIHGNFRVLLIYPTMYRVTGLPVGMASLSAALKEKGFDVRIFDTAFYKEKEVDRYSAQEDERAETMTKPIEDKEDIWKDRPNDMLTDLKILMNEFKPSLVGVSILENTKKMALKMTNMVKENFPDVHVVAGGIFPTLTPEIFLKEPSISYVCVGEGEISFPDLCEKLREKKDPTNTRGFWMRDENGKIHKNPPAMLPDINKIPFPDFAAFDKSLLLKPMQGKIYKTLVIEASRGCVHKCTYCENSLLGDFYSNAGAGRYYRRMDMKKIIEQIYHQVDKHDCNYIHFSSEYFLALSKADFDMFIEEYSKIKIPFYFQTRFETVKGDRMQKLKEVGMHWLGVSLEHGNEDFRKKHLKRGYTNASVANSIKILKEEGIGATVSNMMGFPYENRELVFDTINLCKDLYRIHKGIQFNIFMFTPYRSCSLYQTCVDQGLLPKDAADDIDYGYAFDENTILKFPEEYKKMLAGLYRTFNLYVKLPDEDLPKIKIAEKDDEEGRAMLKELRKKISWEEDPNPTPPTV